MRINLHLRPCRQSGGRIFESITAVRRRGFGLLVVTAIGERGRSVQFHLEWHTDMMRKADFVFESA